MFADFWWGLHIFSSRNMFRWCSWGASWSTSTPTWGRGKGTFGVCNLAKAAKDWKILEATRAQIESWHSPFRPFLHVRLALAWLAGGGKSAEKMHVSVFAIWNWNVQGLQGNYIKWFRGWSVGARKFCPILRAWRVHEFSVTEVFGNTSQRFKAVQELLQNSFTNENGRHLVGILGSPRWVPSDQFLGRSVNRVDMDQQPLGWCLK